MFVFKTDKKSFLDFAVPQITTHDSHYDLNTKKNGGRCWNLASEERDTSKPLRDTQQVNHWPGL